ncbi:MAG: hypothetical protein ABI623_10230 [bacterium]
MFDEEYEANHHKQQDSASVAGPTLTWESFDKDDVQPAFVVHVNFCVAFLFSIPEEQCPAFISLQHIHPVRDKSPPSPSLNVA